MTQYNSIKLFETKKVRTIWDDKEERWYFSIVDVVAVLTDSPNPRKYWSVLKTRLKKEGSELTTNCSQLKMSLANGKYVGNHIKRIAMQNIILLSAKKHYGGFNANKGGL